MTLPRVALLAAVFVIGLANTAAHAAPPACPALPDAITDTALTDTDRLVRELRELRREVVGTCSSTRTGLTEIVGAGGDLAKVRTGIDLARSADTTNATTAHTDAGAIIAAIDATASGADDANPAYVRLASSDSQAQIATDGIRAALWCIAGLLVVSIAAPFLLRTFRA